MNDNTMFATFWVAVTIITISCISSVTSCSVKQNKSNNAVELYKIQKYTPQDHLNARKLKAKENILETISNANTSKSIRKELNEALKGGTIDKFLKMEKQ